MKKLKQNKNLHSSRNKWYYLFKFIPSIIIIITTIVDPSLLHLLITRTFKNSIEPSLLSSNLIKIHHHKFSNTEPPILIIQYPTNINIPPFFFKLHFPNHLFIPSNHLLIRQIFESNVRIRLSSLLPINDNLSRLKDCDDTRRNGDAFTNESIESGDDERGVINTYQPESHELFVHPMLICRHFRHYEFYDRTLLQSFEFDLPPSPFRRFFVASSRNEMIKSFDF